MDKKKNKDNINKAGKKTNKGKKQTLSKKITSSRNNSPSSKDIIIDNDESTPDDVVKELLASRKKSIDDQEQTKKEEQVFIIGKVKKTYLKESDILRALELNAGVLSDTAKMLRTSYSRLKEFIDSNTSLKQAADDVLEVKKDMAESELNKHIAKGNLTAIIFFLKTRAKDRGYVESMDISLPNKPIYFVYKEVKPSEVK